MGDPDIGPSLKMYERTKKSSKRNKSHVFVSTLAPPSHFITWKLLLQAAIFVLSYRKPQNIHFGSVLYAAAVPEVQNKLKSGKKSPL